MDLQVHVLPPNDLCSQLVLHMSPDIAAIALWFFGWTGMTGKVVRVYLLLNFIGDHPTGRPSRFTAETILTTIIVALPLSRKVKGNSKQ